MAASIRPRFALLALFAATPALAQQADPIAAIRADRWADAQRAAAAYADPVATKLVTYFRLLAPGAATADEITDFMAQSPDWPNQALLERRRQEAIAADPDLASTLAQCERNTLTLPQTMLHCAEALANAGRNAEAAEEARRAWVAGHRRRGRLPAPLVGRRAAGRPLGALPAPGLARCRPRRRDRSRAWIRRASRRGRGAAGPAARRAERGRTARRPARQRCGAIPA